MSKKSKPTGNIRGGHGSNAKAHKHSTTPITGVRSTNAGNATSNVRSNGKPVIGVRSK